MKKLVLVFVVGEAGDGLAGKQVLAAARDQVLLVFVEAVLGADPDDVSLRAELACYGVVSACPQDLVQINAGTPGPIDLEITRA